MTSKTIRIDFRLNRYTVTDILALHVAEGGKLPTSIRQADEILRDHMRKWGTHFPPDVNLHHLHADALLCVSAIYPEL